MGDKLSDDERSNVESAIQGVEEAMKGDDKEAIEAAVEKLSKAGQVVYQKAADQAQAQEDASANGGAGNDDVVDAEFEEVDEGKKEN
jgi:molecular chaperone DnaK